MSVLTQPIQHEHGNTGACCTSFSQGKVTESAMPILGISGNRHGNSYIHFPAKKGGDQHSLHSKRNQKLVPCPKGALDPKRNKGEVTATGERLLYWDDWEQWLLPAPTKHTSSKAALSGQQGYEEFSLVCLCLPILETTEFSFLAQESPPGAAGWPLKRTTARLPDHLLNYTTRPWFCLGNMMGKSCFFTYPLTSFCSEMQILIDHL